MEISIDELHNNEYIYICMENRFIAEQLSNFDWEPPFFNISDNSLHFIFGCSFVIFIFSIPFIHLDLNDEEIYQRIKGLGKKPQSGISNYIVNYGKNEHIKIIFLFVYFFILFISILIFIIKKLINGGFTNINLIITEISYFVTLILINIICIIFTIILFIFSLKFLFDKNVNISFNKIIVQQKLITLVIFNFFMSIFYFK